jgi:hypothetical protein
VSKSSNSSDLPKITRAEFEGNFLPALHEWELETSRTKGNEYAGEDDALRNFKEAAADLGLSPLQVCAVHLHKQYCAIMSYARLGHNLSTESLRSRVGDLRLYAALFLALAEEAQWPTS